MKKPICYIASSWKNKNAVELLTNNLEHIGVEVKSFIRNSTEIEQNSLEQWISTPDAHEKFTWDVFWTKNADIVIYVGPSGCDAWAEVGAAYSAKRAIYGLREENEQIGLMRKMVSRWFDDYLELIMHIKDKWLGGNTDEQSK